MTEQNQSRLFTFIFVALFIISGIMSLRFVLTSEDISSNDISSFETKVVSKWTNKSKGSSTRYIKFTLEDGSYEDVSISTTTYKSIEVGDVVTIYNYKNMYSYYSDGIQERLSAKKELSITWSVFVLLITILFGKSWIRSILKGE